MTKTKRRDITYLVTLLFCVVWFAVLSFSNCEWTPGPYSFVSGCHNYGIDWNKWLAPTGVIMLFAYPISVIYWLLRLIGIGFKGIRLGYRKLTLRQESALNQNDQ